MNKSEKAAIVKWVKAVASGDRTFRYNNPTRNPMGVHILGDAVFLGGLVLAESHRGYVELGVPGPGMWGRLKLLQKELTRLSVPHITVNRRVVPQASVDMSDLTVIDNHDDTYTPESLILAATHTHGKSRRAFYLSGFDKQEFFPAYFFCELPPGATPTTIEEAYESLKPEAVRLAESMGRKVKRQGDIFAIPLKDFTPKREPTEDLRVDLTNHRVTGGLIYREGGNKVFFARGKLMHRPRFRRPDHKTLRLGRQWHLVLKNTVPVVDRGW